MGILFFLFFFFNVFANNSIFLSALVEQLLMKMDRELYDFLQTTDMGLMFCHRFVAFIDRPVLML